MLEAVTECFEPSFFRANWPAPPQVQTLLSTRDGGFSQRPYGSLNLGDHVGDDSNAVSRNRQKFMEAGAFLSCQWLQQVHGVDVVEARGDEILRADGAHTSERSLACAVLTADCLPVLLCDTEGTQVAAVHAGWRGLALGILAKAVHRFRHPKRVIAYLGPAISQRHFEVDQPVVEAFARLFDASSLPWGECFEPILGKPGHFGVDLYGLARCHLHSLGVCDIYGGEHCTFAQKDRFYSFRRDGATGRQVAAIWLAPVDTP